MNYDLPEIDFPDDIKGWPPALNKARCDPFDYFILLRTGQVLYVETVEYLPESPDWVRIKLHRGIGSRIAGEWRTADGGCPTFDRDIEVRLADIVAVADAPFGS